MSTEIDPSDYERPARKLPRGTGVFKLRGFVVLVELAQLEDGAWCARGVVEARTVSWEYSLPIKHVAPTAREAWAALLAELARRLQEVTP